MVFLESREPEVASRQSDTIRVGDPNIVSLRSDGIVMGEGIYFPLLGHGGVAASHLEHYEAFQQVV